MDNLEDNNTQESPFLSIKQAPRSQKALQRALYDLFPRKNSKSLANLVHNHRFLDAVCAGAALRRVESLGYYKRCSVSLTPHIQNWYETLLLLRPSTLPKALVVDVEEPRGNWKLAVQTSAGIKNTVALGANVKGSILNLFGTLSQMNGSFGIGAENMEDSVSELMLSKMVFAGGGRERLAEWLLRRRPGRTPMNIEEAVDVAEGRAVHLSCGCRLLSRGALRVDEEDIKDINPKLIPKGKLRSKASAVINTPVGCMAPNMVLSGFAVANAGAGGAIGVEVCQDFNTLDELRMFKTIKRLPRVRLWHMIALDRLTRSGYRTRRFRYGATLSNEVSADLADYANVNYRKHTLSAQMILGLGGLGSLGSLSRSVSYPAYLSVVLDAGTMHALGSACEAPPTYAAIVHGFERVRGSVIRSIEMHDSAEPISVLSYASVKSTLNVRLPVPKQVPFSPMLHAFADIGTTSPSSSLVALAHSFKDSFRAAVGCGMSIEVGAGTIELSFCVPLKITPHDLTKKYCLSALPGIF